MTTNSLDAVGTTHPPSTWMFFLLQFLAQPVRLRKPPFFLSWWAYSFPLAAVTVATEVMTDALRMPTFMQALSWVLLTATSLLVLVLGARTVRAMVRGEVCVPG